jgi:hypothetical protein
MMQFAHILVSALFGHPFPIGPVDGETTGHVAVHETRADRLLRVQQQMLVDYEAGRQHCLVLEGKQRDACDARAAATARAPQGRLGREQVGPGSAGHPDADADATGGSADGG